MLELWHLPEGTFPSSAVATVVVLARKLPAGTKPGRAPVRIERVGSSTAQRQEFSAEDRPTESFVFPSQETWRADPEARMHSSFLERLIWSRLTSRLHLGDVARIRNGIIPGAYPGKRSRGEWAQTKRSPEWKPWLEGAGNLQPYRIRWQGDYVRYPANLHWPRRGLAPVFDAPSAKVLFNANRAPGNPWRLYAAVDRVGYYPSQGIHCAIAKDGASVEEIAAVLNSPFASAWVDSYIRHRWITESTLERMPYPEFSQPARRRIGQLVREAETWWEEAETAALASTELSRRYASVVSAIDDLVLDAYGVDADGREALRRLFVGHRRPGPADVGVSAPTPDRAPARAADDGRVWLVTGQVVDVLPDEGAVRLSISGYNRDEPFVTRIPEAMPGWALRPDQPFQAKLSWDLRETDPPPADRLRGFRPLEFAFASTTELIDLLSAPGTISKSF